MNLDPGLLTTPEGRELGRVLSGILDRLDSLEAGQRSSQLSNSSMHRASLDVYDADGTVRQHVGAHDDGSYTTTDVNGPPPPMPSSPVVEPVPGGFTVRWDGTFTGGQTRPYDWRRVDVHIDLATGFEPTLSTVDAGILVPGGATLHFTTAPPGPGGHVPHYVRLVAINTSGVWSDPTAEVSVTPAQLAEGDLAPGAVGAIELADGAVEPQHLVAEFVLANVVVIGDPDAGHILLDGPANEIAAHQPDGLTRTFLVDGDTGDVQIVGLIATAPDGPRITFNDGFDNGGTNITSIRTVTFRGNNPAVAHLYSGDATDTTGAAGTFLNVARTYTAGGTQDYPVFGFTDRARMAIAHAGVDGSGNAHPDHMSLTMRLASGITLNGGEATNGTWYAHSYLPSGTIAASTSPQWRHGWVFKDTSGAITHKCGVTAPHPAGVTSPGIVFVNCASAQVVSTDGSAWVPIAASAFNVNSARDRKKDIGPLPASALGVLRGTPIQSFRYVTDGPDTPARVGPMVEDLPEWVRAKAMTLPGRFGTAGADASFGELPDLDGLTPPRPPGTGLPHGPGEPLPTVEGEPVDAGDGYDLVRWVNTIAEAVRQLDEEMDPLRGLAHVPVPTRRKPT